MTLGGVRGFFRTPIVALGYKEWTDGFNIENIPATVLDGAYHLDIGPLKITVLGVQASAYAFSYPVTLKVFKKGFRDPAAAIDGALDAAEGIIGALVNASVNNVGLKQISPTGLQTQPLQLSNDNAVILVMNFVADLVLSF